MLQPHRRDESGQIMVIMALAIVGLLGFAALAIDVGLVYADRRAEQNAADASALSGAQQAMQAAKSVQSSSFQCNTAGAWVTSTTGWSAPAWLPPDVLNGILSKARTMAQNNGYLIEIGLATQNGVAFRCGSSQGTNFIEVRVVLTRSTRASFAQLFGRNQITNTVEAISRVRLGGPAMGGYLVYVIDPACNKPNGGGGNSNNGGIDWNGNVNAYLFGGGAFTRSCLSANGTTTFSVLAPGATTSSCKNATGTGSHGIHCEDNNQSSHSDWCDDPKDNFSPGPAWGSDPLPGFYLPDIATCSTNVTTTTPSGGNFTPGTYQIDSKTWDGARLSPGLYCIKGNIEVQGNGASISSVDGTGADGGATHGVTLFMIDGGISCKGQCNLNLKAVPVDDPHKPAGAVPGLVLMSKHGNTSLITWGGNSGSSFSGTVYVPDGPLDLGGTGDIPTSSQFIAKYFKSHGNSQLCVKYDANAVVQSPAAMDLSR